jgi:hypothetical protein
MRLSLKKRNNRQQISSYDLLKPLNEKEQSLIQGGGGPYTTAQLMTMFLNNAPSSLGSQLTDTQLAEFTQVINQLNSTAVGSQILDALYQTGDKITLAYNKSIDNGQGDQFDPNVNATTNTTSLSFGFFGVPTNSSGTALAPAADAGAINFQFISHELYHAYEHLSAYPDNTPANATANSGFYSSVRVELDAEIFAGMAMTEYDASNSNANFIPILNGIGEYTPDMVAGSNQTSAANTAFSAAWTALVTNKTYTLANYNILIENFTAGSQYSNGNPIAGENANPITATTSNVIATLFNTAYNPPAPVGGSSYTPPSGSGSAGSAGGASGNYSTIQAGDGSTLIISNNTYTVISNGTATTTNSNGTTSSSTVTNYFTGTASVGVVTNYSYVDAKGNIITEQVDSNGSLIGYSVITPADPNNPPAQTPPPPQIQPIPPASYSSTDPTGTDGSSDTASNGTGSGSGDDGSGDSGDDGDAGGDGDDAYITYYA